MGGRGRDRGRLGRRGRRRRDGLPRPAVALDAGQRGHRTDTGRGSVRCADRGGSGGDRGMADACGNASPRARRGTELRSRAATASLALEARRDPRATDARRRADRGCRARRERELTVFAFGRRRVCSAGADARASRRVRRVRASCYPPGCPGWRLRSCSSLWQPSDWRWLAVGHPPRSDHPTTRWRARRSTLRSTLSMTPSNRVRRLSLRTRRWSGHMAPVGWPDRRSRRHGSICIAC